MAVVIFFGVYVSGQPETNVVLNEICTANVRCVEDENGEFPDWMEIYNPTDRVIDLSGYIINDSIDLVTNEKFIIPDGTILEPGAYYLFDPKFLVSSQGETVNLLDRKRRYVDRVEVPALKYDTTYARVSDGSYEWAVK
ncbi:MAG: lamin tail domain-containing protein, partial [Lachnospiraceae bacterium]|nr:lamin tail domain-containing protein [Lachnospiraceae bacterium]